MPDRARLPRGKFRFRLTALIAFACLAAPVLLNAASDSKPLPIYPSKPSGFGGLFPEELISISQLRNKQLRREAFILLDARGITSYNTGHITGAILPLSADYYRKEELFRKGLWKNPPDRDKDLAESMKKYPKGIPIVTYCNNNCQASAVLLIQIKHLGFTNVRAMNDGIQSWQAAGYPVEAVSIPVLPGGEKT